MSIKRLDSKAWIVCPHCLHETDPTDYSIAGDFAGTEKCEECGGEYEFEGEHEITWYTWAKRYSA